MASETHIVADNLDGAVGEAVPASGEFTTGNFSGQVQGSIINNLNAQDLGAEVLSQMTDPRLLNCLCEEPLPDMVTNGDFATDTDWDKLPDWVIAGGKATYTSPSSAYRDISQTIGNLIPGEKYIVTYTIDSIGAGTGIVVGVGGTVGTIRTSAGTYTETIVCGATTKLDLDASLTLGEVVVIDNVSATPAYIDISGKIHYGQFIGSWASGDRENKGRVWQYDMTGNTDKYIDMDDHDDFSFGDGSNDSPFSIFILVEVVDGITQTIVAKYDNTTGSEEREYLIQIYDTRFLSIRIYDESANVKCDLITDNALSVGYHLIEFTYSGVGGATAMNGGTIYIDGLEVASTASNDASYVAMENMTTPLFIGINIITTGVAGNFLNGDFGIIGIDAVERSASDAWQLWLTILGKYSENGITL